MMRVLLLISFLALGHAAFEKECLDAHNMYRKKHAAPPLQLSVELQKSALIHAQNLAKHRNLRHSGHKYGENLYKSFETGVNAELAVKDWYDEVKNYSKSDVNRTAHFNQVVWKSSKLLGCAYAQTGDYVYYVANYEPSANSFRDYSENIMIPTASGSIRRLLHILMFINAILINTFFSSRYV